jgi:hypothetical protein
VTSSHRRGYGSRLALAALVWLAACRPDAPLAPRPREVNVAINAALTADQQALIAGMSVEVTGPGIAVPIVSVLDVAGATVNGTVAVPVGGGRRFLVHAYDATAAETHTGEATVTVRPGSNPALVITLYARSGGVPVVVTVGTFALTLDVGSVVTTVGATVVLEALVHDAGVPVTAGVVRWGALDPTLARLVPSADGRSLQLTGLRAGATTLVASIGGIATAVPVTVAAAAGPERFLANIHAIGPTHTCVLALRRGALADSIARVLCWGENTHGQVGVSGAGPFFTPRLVTTVREGLQMNLAAGAAHTCVTPTGAAGDPDGGGASCWGDATAFGGDPAVQGPQRFVLPPGEATHHLAAGFRHTCVATVAGTVYCAGDPGHGRLGGIPATPRALVATAPRNGVPFFAVAGGARHTCALNNAWEIWCWGANDKGQLGDGTTTPSPAPVRVAGGREWGYVWAGEDVTCGYTQFTQELYCWGDNSRGQLRRVPGPAGSEGPLPFAHTPRLVAAPVQLSGLVDAVVPVIRLNDFTTTLYWRLEDGAIVESQLFPGLPLVYSASFGDRFCGLPFIADLRCSGSYPGDGSASSSSLVMVDLSTAIAAAGSTP